MKKINSTKVLIRESDNVELFRVRDGKFRVLYKAWFGDDRMVADFDRVQDAQEMFELVDDETVTKSELYDLGFGQ